MTTTQPSYLTLVPPLDPEKCPNYTEQSNPFWLLEELLSNISQNFDHYNVGPGEVQFISKTHLLGVQDPEALIAASKVSAEAFQDGIRNIVALALMDSEYANKILTS